MRNWFLILGLALFIGVSTAQGNFLQSGEEFFAPRVRFILTNTKMGGEVAEVLKEKNLVSSIEDVPNFILNSKNSTARSLRAEFQDIVQRSHLSPVYLWPENASGLDITELEGLRLSVQADMLSKELVEFVHPVRDPVAIDYILWKAGLKPGDNPVLDRFLDFNFRYKKFYDSRLGLKLARSLLDQTQTKYRVIKNSGLWFINISDQGDGPLNQLFRKLRRRYKIKTLVYNPVELFTSTAAGTFSPGGKMTVGDETLALADRDRYVLVHENLHGQMGHFQTSWFTSLLDEEFFAEGSGDGFYNFYFSESEFAAYSANLRIEGIQLLDPSLPPRVRRFILNEMILQSRIIEIIALQKKIIELKRLAHVNSDAVAEEIARPDYSDQEFIKLDTYSKKLRAHGLRINPLLRPELKVDFARSRFTLKLDLAKKLQEQTLAIQKYFKEHNSEILSGDPDFIDEYVKIVSAPFYFLRSHQGAGFKSLFEVDEDFEWRLRWSHADLSKPIVTESFWGSLKKKCAERLKRVWNVKPK